MEFRAGAALSRSFTIFFRNVVGFLILGVLVSSPVLIHNYWIFSADDLFTLAERAESASLLWRLLEYLVTFLVQATVVYAVFQQLRGEKAPLGKAIGVGLSRLLSVVGVVILLGLALIGAALPGLFMGIATKSPIVMMIAIAVPVLLVYVAFYVAVPASVVERPGVMMALKRSQQLTEGHRWGVFGLVLVTVVLAAVIAFVLQRAFVGDIFNATIGDWRTYFTIQAVVSLVFSIFGAVVTAVTYHDLRLEKDGVSVDELAAVFE